MPTVADVRKIALALPGAIEGEGTLAFSVATKTGKAKGFAWSWKERVHPKRARVENLGVLAVRVANDDEKQMLLAADPDALFTEPHYNGFPAVLVRLAAVKPAALRALIVNAWRCQAPPAAVAAYDASPPKRRAPARRRGR